MSDHPWLKYREQAKAEEAGLHQMITDDVRVTQQDAEIARLRVALATARRDGMKEAAQRLEELHKNHGYNPQTGEVWRLGKIETCPLTIDHTIGYYRAIAEGVAHILRAAKEEK